MRSLGINMFWPWPTLGINSSKTLLWRLCGSGCVQEYTQTGITEKGHISVGQLNMCLFFKVAQNSIIDNVF